MGLELVPFWDGDRETEVLLRCPGILKMLGGVKVGFLRDERLLDLTVGLGSFVMLVWLLMCVLM